VSDRDRRAIVTWNNVKIISFDKFVPVQDKDETAI